MLGFQLDVTDRRTFRSSLWPERRPARLERQRRQFVLIVDGVDQTAIGGRRRQEFLGPGSRYDGNGSEHRNDSDIYLDLDAQNLCALVALAWILVLHDVSRKGAKTQSHWLLNLNEAGDTSGLVETSPTKDE